MKDYYKILGLTKDATSDLIKQKFRELALENHPDISANKNSNDVFIEIYEAYHILSQPYKKFNYDLLYDNYFNNAKTHISNEEHVKTDIQNDSYSAREKGQQKAKVKYKDFIKDLDCFFMSGVKASGIPYSYSMHKNIGISGGVGPLGSIKSRIINIPIPRSKKAHFFHKIGFLIKGLFLVLAITAFKLDVFSNYTMISKTLVSTSIVMFGGLITLITYHLVEVKSKFFHAKNFSLIKKYKSKGYKRGFHPMISNTPIGLIAYLFRLIF